MRGKIGILAVLMWAACSREAAPGSDDRLVAMTFEVSAPQVKALMDGSRALWEVGDRVAVYDNIEAREAHVFTVERVDAVANTATITGSVYEGATTFTAVSPYAAAVSHDGALKVRVEASQTLPDGANADAGSLVAVAQGKGTSLRFVNVVGLLKLEVDIPGVSAIRFLGKDRSVLGGTFSVDTGSGEVFGTDASAAELSLTPTAGTFAEGTTVYLPVIPATLGGVVLDLEMKGELRHRLRHSDNDLKIRAGEIRSLGKVSDVAWSTAPPYTNPVIDVNCPDPSVLDDRSRTGWFYAYSTQNDQGDAPSKSYLPVYRSKDLVQWEFVANAFGGSNRPTWNSDEARVWAPDVAYIGGKYVLYYALGNNSNASLGASGVAVSDSPTGPFTDLGCIASEALTGVYNSIDPAYFADGGRQYLFWGSYGSKSGIHVAELADDGLSLKTPSSNTLVAGSGSSMEGCYVYKRGSYYYLFASMGSGFTEDPKENTYRLIVGRSTSVTGPYVGRSGKRLTASGFTAQTDIIMQQASGEAEFVGPGHNGPIITDDRGVDWMVMHARWKDGEHKYAAPYWRTMILERVYWTEDGWPYFGNGGHPSLWALGPVFAGSPYLDGWSGAGMEDLPATDFPW